MAENRNIHTLLSVFLALMIPFAARAATSSVWTQIRATVTQPEVVPFSGALHTVSQIAIPVEPCIPTAPCRNVPITMHLNLAGVTGVGQTSGLRYRVTGAVDMSGIINLPGQFAVNPIFQLIPPNPIIPPSPIKITVVLSADSSGNVTASASQPQDLDRKSVV